MTDNICDSWEDVDVEKIVIKQANKSNKKSLKSIENVKNSNGSTTFKVLQRTPTTTAVATPVATTTTTTTTWSSTPLTTTATTIASVYESPFEDRPKVILEDSTRSQPPTVKLRILNRPVSKQDQVKDTLTSEQIQQQLIRSYEEKQAEYAKARLRILGEEMPKDENSMSRITDRLDQLSMGGNNRGSTTKSSPNKAPMLTGNTSRSGLLTPTVNTNNVVLIREPFVPDGSRGFRYVR